MPLIYTFIFILFLGGRTTVYLYGSQIYLNNNNNNNNNNNDNNNNDNNNNKPRTVDTQIRISAIL